MADISVVGMTSQTTIDKAPPPQDPAPAPAKGLRGHPWLTLFSVDSVS
ncbi:hypothetical protein GCM10010353_16700 [Streptomyces chryseus]|nr:hypothetical protein GCM10010353_16700 [Streptomyces chryseus]